MSGFNIGDVDLGTPSPMGSDPPAPDPPAPDPGSNGQSEPVEKPYEVPVGGKVLRWILKAVPSEQSMRKLHAVCVLTEGDVPLRIVNLKGHVIMSESEGVLVIPEKFLFLADLFGLS